jgi:hypothetical protein
MQLHEICLVCLNRLITFCTSSIILTAICTVPYIHGLLNSVHILLLQVFISYGKKSSGELLLSYGFVPREGTNPNDSVELLVSLNKSDKCFKEKLQALKKNGLSE